MHPRHLLKNFFQKLLCRILLIVFSISFFIPTTLAQQPQTVYETPEASVSNFQARINIEENYTAPAAPENVIPFHIYSNQESPTGGYAFEFTYDTAQAIADGKMASDCSDLRIVGPDGSYQQYEIQTCNQPDTAIRFMSGIINPGETLYYLTYSDTSAATQQPYGTFGATQTDFKSKLGSQIKSATPDAGTTMGGYEIILDTENFNSGVTLYSHDLQVPHSNSFAGQDYYDMQVNYTFDTAAQISAGRMETDCSDIHFTQTINGRLMEIPFWLEEGCNTSSTTFWIKMPRIQYNNPSKSNIQLWHGDTNYGLIDSNPHRTFDFFDDFSEDITTSGNWNVYNGTYGTDFSQSAGQLQLLTNSPIIETTSRFSDDNRNTWGFLVRTLAETTTRPANGFTLAGFYGTSLDNHGLGMQSTNDEFKEYIDSVAAPLISLDLTGSPQIYELFLRTFNTPIYQFFSPDNNTLLSAAIGTATAKIHNDRLTLGRPYDLAGNGETTNHTWDWISVGKVGNFKSYVYSSTDPTSPNIITTEAEILINDNKVNYTDLGSGQIRINEMPKETEIGDAEIEIINPNGSVDVYRNIFEYKAPEITGISPVKQRLDQPTIDLNIAGNYFNQGFYLLPFTVTNQQAVTLYNKPILFRENFVEQYNQKKIAADCSDLFLLEDNKRTPALNWIEYNSGIRCDSSSDTLVWSRTDLSPSEVRNYYLAYNPDNQISTEQNRLVEFLWPATSESLKAWMKSNYYILTSGTDVSQWWNAVLHDSPHFAAIQNTSANRPVLNPSNTTFNDFPTISFNNANQEYLDVNFDSAGTGIFRNIYFASLISVFQPSSTSPSNSDRAPIYYVKKNSSYDDNPRLALYNWISSGTHRSSINWISPDSHSGHNIVYTNNFASPLSPNIYEGYPQYATARGLAFINNIVTNQLSGIPDGSMTASSPEYIRIGNGERDATVDYLSGDIAEIFVFHDSLIDNINLFDKTNSQIRDPRNSRLLLYDYLNQKYQINSNLPTVVQLGDEINNSMKVHLGLDLDNNGYYGEIYDFETTVTPNYFNKNSLSIETPNLTQPGRYDLIAENHDGQRGMFTEVFRVGEETAPLNLKADSASGGIMVQWDAPAEYSSNITGYELIYGENGLCNPYTYLPSSENGTTDCTTISFGPTQNEVSVFLGSPGSLISENNYNFAVYAFSNDYTGPSYPSNIDTAIAKEAADSATLSATSSSVEANDQDFTILTSTFTNGGLGVEGLEIKLLSDSRYLDNTIPVDCDNTSIEVDNVTDSQGRVCYKVSAGNPGTRNYTASTYSLSSNSVSVDYFYTQSDFSVNEFFWRYDDGDETTATPRTDINQKLEDIYIDNYEDSPKEYNSPRLRFGLANNGNNIPMSNLDETSFNSAFTTHDLQNPLVYGDYIYVNEIDENTVQTNIIRISKNNLSVNSFSESSVSGIITAMATDPVNDRIVAVSTNGSGDTSLLYINPTTLAVTNTINVTPPTTPTSPSPLNGKYHLNIDFYQDSGNGINYIITHGPGSGTPGYITKVYDDLSPTVSHLNLSDHNFISSAIDTNNGLLYATYYTFDTILNRNIDYLTRINLETAFNQPVTKLTELQLSEQPTHYLGAVIDQNREILYLTGGNTIYKYDIDPVRSLRKIADLSVEIETDKTNYFGHLAEIDSINQKAYFDIQGSNLATDRDRLIRVDLTTFSHRPTFDTLFFIPIPYLNLNDGVYDPDTGIVYTAMNDPSSNVDKVIANEVNWRPFIFLEYQEDTDNDCSTGTWVSNWSGFAHWEGSSSQSLAYQEPTTNLLSPGGLIFKPGAFLADNDFDLDVPFTLGSLEYTEFEFKFANTQSADYGNYCFKINGVGPSPITIDYPNGYPQAELYKVVIRESQPAAGQIPSTDLVEGSAPDTYTVTIVKQINADDYGPDLDVTISPDDITLANGEPVIKSISVDNQTPTINTAGRTNPEATITLGETVGILESVVSIDVNQDNEIQGARSLPIYHSYNPPLRTLNTNLNDTQETLSTVSFNVFGDVTMTLDSTFEFDPYTLTSETPNYLTDPISLTVSDTTGQNIEYLLTAQSDIFPINGVTSCSNPGDAADPNCLPLNHMYILASDFNNTNWPALDAAELDAAIDDNFIENYDANTNDPVLFRNNDNFSTLNETFVNNQFKENNTPAILNIIESANAPYSVKGDTDLNIYLMLDYPYFSFRSPGTYTTVLTFTLTEVLL